MVTSFSFLITTDNHLGYKEDDHIRQPDSYKAFEEALTISRKRDVDFVLLGGDLFHVNRPSSSVEHRCIKILRRHLNAQVDRPTSFKRISGQFSHCNKVSHGNFEDPNLKVPHPILTIHGNHDDPTGPRAQSVCEKLATSGLLNYFGAVGSRDLKSISIEPIILQKGPIKIALYGLGFIPDYKLKILFDRGEVHFAKPLEDAFNVLIVHQNRVPLNKAKYIPDDVFPKFFHLIIRGHEHTTLEPEPIPDSKVGGMVYQPGSTVATSISTMEAGPKKIGIATVNLIKPDGDPSNMYAATYELIDLVKCRKMILKDISQKELFKHIKQTYGTTRITSELFKRYSREYIQSRCEELIGSKIPVGDERPPAKKKRRDDAEVMLYQGGTKKFHDISLPLLRIRLEYVSKTERFDELELSNLFYPEKVANKDILLFKKQKVLATDSGTSENVTFNADDAEEEEEDFEGIDLGQERRDTVDVMIENYFLSRPPEQRLTALSLNEYTDAIRGSSEDGNVISKVLNKKKQDVFKKYLQAIQKDPKKFHNEHTVRDWFIQAFGIYQTKDVKAGDSLVDMDVICCE